MERYEVNSSFKDAPILAALVIVVGGLVIVPYQWSRSVGEGVIAGALWAVFLVAGWHGFWRSPSAIEVRADALALESRSGTTTIPWADLEYVGLPWIRRSPSLRIKWRGGRVWARREFDGLHRLLTEIERRAPQAVVRI